MGKITESEEESVNLELVDVAHRFLRAVRAGDERLRACVMLIDVTTGSVVVSAHKQAVCDLAGKLLTDMLHELKSKCACCSCSSDHGSAGGGQGLVS